MNKKSVYLAITIFHQQPDLFVTGGTSIHCNSHLHNATPASQGHMTQLNQSTQLERVHGNHARTNTVLALGFMMSQRKHLSADVKGFVVKIFEYFKAESERRSPFFQST